MEGSEEMKLIVALGNPGKQYAFTRHNAGFLMADFYAQEHNFSINRIKFKGLVGETVISGEKILFLKPQTFMNLSGESVREAADFYKIPSEDILVIYDDISLELGRLRIRRKGTDGGHNGIKNIIYHLNSDVFPRVKIGINEKRLGTVKDFVLSPFPNSSLEVLREIAKINMDVIDTFVTEGVDAAMNRYNATNLMKEGEE